MPENCTSCKFEKDRDVIVNDKSTCLCTRFPPRQAGDTERPDLYPFPVVNADCWCGEYKHK